MMMSEYVAKLSFMLGFPSNKNIEGIDLSQAMTMAFDELKEYMKTPVSLTVPYAMYGCESRTIKKAEH